MNTPCFFVGIAGGSGSGKTFLARALADGLGNDRAAVIETDAYYRDLSHLPAARRGRINFDHPDALEEALLVSHLKTLARGVAIDKPVYDFSTHTRTGKTLVVRPRPFILVEGVMILAIPSLAACLDYTLFLDIPADLRFIRRLQRDQADRGRSASQIIEQYLTQVRPMYEALVAPFRETADQVFTSAPDVPGLIQTLWAARCRSTGC